jgi:fused signal recognition particle receptor
MEIALYSIIAVALIGFLVLVTRKKDNQIASDQSPQIESPAVSVPALKRESNIDSPPQNKDQQIKDDQRFFAGLSKSRGILSRSFQRIFGGGINEEVLEELEEALIMADVGVHTSMALVQTLRDKAKSVSDASEYKNIVREELLSLLGPSAPLTISEAKPHVILMIGVNGSGKTTTIGKLAHRLVQQGKTVMVAAGDTFRAGAIEQLEVWAERVGAQFISASPGADPASVIHNALTAAKARNIDVLLCDTAGRLQAQQALMDELGKVVKVSRKIIPEAPHETLLVLDATIGQNALSQAQGFTKVAPVSGVVLTKLDGTAKGGVVLTVKRELGLPVRLVGLGEGKEDLRDFNAKMFVNALMDQSQTEEEV